MKVDTSAASVQVKWVRSLWGVLVAGTVVGKLRGQGVETTVTAISVEGVLLVDTGICRLISKNVIHQGLANGIVLCGSHSSKGRLKSHSPRYDGRNKLQTTINDRKRLRVWIGRLDVEGVLSFKPSRMRAAICVIRQ